MINTEFLLAGNATFTVSNPEGEHYTFKVKKTKHKNNNGKYSFFISILTGPDFYTYLGMVVSPYDGYGHVTLTRKSKFNIISLPFKVSNWAVKHVMADVPLPKGYKVDHAGKCGKCGRKLTTPESIEAGLGPICRGKRND